MNVPRVTRANVNRMYELFNYTGNEFNVRLEYVEPIIGLKDALWKVEFRSQTRQPYSRSQLSTFVNTLINILGNFEYQDIYFNYCDRIYLLVFPSSNDISNKPPSKITRDEKRASFRKEARYNDNNSGQENKSPIINNINNTEAKLQNQGNSTSDTMYKNFILSHIQNNNNEEGTIGITNNILQKPIVKMTVDSLTSSDKLYALSRFNEPRVFDLARLYLGYLRSSDTPTKLGETKLSVEVKLKQEGLPINDELSELYYTYLQKKDFTKPEIERDLESISNYHRTDRLIRLQTAREKTVKWFGSYGGKNNYLMPVEYPYFKLEPFTDPTEYRSGRLLNTLSDEIGEILQFC